MWSDGIPLRGAWPTDILGKGSETRTGGCSGKAAPNAAAGPQIG